MKKFVGFAWLVLRGFLIGLLYSGPALIIATIALSIGLSETQSIWSGIISSQVLILVISMTGSQRIGREHEIVRSRTQTELVKQLTKVLIK